jgi:hypothetical protein
MLLDPYTLQNIILVLIDMLGGKNSVQKMQKSNVN